MLLGDPKNCRFHSRAICTQDLSIWVERPPKEYFSSEKAPFLELAIPGNIAEGQLKRIFWGKLSKSKSPRERSAPINICKMRLISLPGARQLRILILRLSWKLTADSLLSAETMLAMGVVFWRSPAMFATCFCLLFNTSVIVCAPSPNMFVTAFVILPLSVWVLLLAQPDTPFCNGQKSSAQALAVFVAAYAKPTLVMPKGNGLKASPCVHIKCLHRVLVD